MALDTPSESDKRSVTEDERPARLRALAEHLKAHGYKVELSGDDTRLDVIAPDPPHLGAVILCLPRAKDGGRLWFTADGEALAEAHDIVGATVAIKGLLASPSDLIRDPALDGLRTESPIGFREIQAAEAGFPAPAKRRS
jgi:hypothetical protein